MAAFLIKIHIPPASHGHHIAARLAADENDTSGPDEEADFTFKHTQSGSICQIILGQLRTHMQTGRNGVLRRAHHYTPIHSWGRTDGARPRSPGIKSGEEWRSAALLGTLFISNSNAQKSEGRPDWCHSSPVAHHAPRLGLIVDVGLAGGVPDLHASPLWGGESDSTVSNFRRAGARPERGLADRWLSTSVLRLCGKHVTAVHEAHTNQTRRIHRCISDPHYSSHFCMEHKQRISKVFFISALMTSTIRRLGRSK